MTPILANAGVPMLFFHLPAMVLALVPVIAVEWWVARRWYGVERWAALKGVAVANCFSALLGFPLFWLLWVVVEVGFAGTAIGIDGTWEKVYAVTVQSAWLVPYEAELAWMIPAAGLFMLIPAFFVSVYSERWILRSAWRVEQVATVRRFSWAAHAASYPILAVVWLLYVLHQLEHF